MKKIIFWLSAILIFTTVSCLEEPQPESIDDVCVLMDDPVFIEYCYDNFDLNKDGKISIHEAECVYEIDLSGLHIKSLTGLDNFTNLIKLDCSNKGISKLDVNSCKKL